MGDSCVVAWALRIHACHIAVKEGSRATTSETSGSMAPSRLPTACHLGIAETRSRVRGNERDMPPSRCSGMPSTSYRVQPPRTGHTLQLVLAFVPELDASPHHVAAHCLADQHLA